MMKFICECIVFVFNDNKTSQAVMALWIKQANKQIGYILFEVIVNTNWLDTSCGPETKITIEGKLFYYKSKH